MLETITITDPEVQRFAPIKLCYLYLGKVVPDKVIKRTYLDVKLAVSCNLLNMCEAAAAIEAMDGAVAIEWASVRLPVVASMMSSVLMLCLAVSVVVL